MKQTPSPSSNTKIEFNDVHKGFASKKVLQGVNFTLEKGKSLVIIGGSGSGKSVILKSLLGIMLPDKGAIFIDGEETTRISGAQRDRVMLKFGMLFQGGALFDSLPVWENITFALRQQEKINREQAKEIAVSKLNSVGLGADVSRLYPSELSGGMQKRVALARAICMNPDIILFDEPTTGLDPIMAAIINELIVKCSEELGATTITITHDMHSAKAIADDVAMLYQGTLIWTGAVDTLEDSGNPFVEQFIHGTSIGPIEVKLQDH
ncbi:MAG: ATP-binding cassette domain-containing protein [Alphaproteobacteria bacterium]|nr:ATP-binding cassette domain-containing protein [Alphaproteobacteria bacterium]